MLLALWLAGLLQAVLTAAPSTEIHLSTDKPAMEFAPHPDSNRHVIPRVFDAAQKLTADIRRLLQNAWPPSVFPPKHQRTACFIMACFMAACCAAMLARPVSAQDLDATVDEVRPPRHRLVWENVRSGNHHSGGQHLRGVQPNLGLALKRATVELAPGESSEFLVPDGEFMQVVSTNGVKLDDGQTRLWVSNGSGLYRRHTAAISDDGLTLMAAPIAPGSGNGNWIARVTRSPTASCFVQLALYTSARPELNLLDYYSCRIDLGPSCPN